MAGTSQFSWDTSVPDLLKSGSVLTKWEEESNSVADVNFRVDEFGFYLAWCEEDKVGNCLDLCHVSEIRLGGVPKDGSKVREALQTRGQDPQEELEDRCFTVVYGINLVDLSFLHLCASSAQLANEWLEGLGPLLHNLKLYNCSPITQLHKLYVKIGHLVGASGKFSVKSICKCLNAGKYEQNLLDGLEALGLPCGKSDELEPGSFTFEQFYELYLKVCPRLEIDQLRVEWGGGRAPFLNVKQMVDFLNQEQRDPRLNEILFPYYDKDRALSIIQKYESSLDNRKRDRITVKGLTQYLLSEENVLIMPSHVQMYQDMNQPLSHYFINSSHNTYLVGRQIGGKSSVDMYRECLLAGCRCIELDCWDGPGDEPIITHGKAMCTNIWFKDVIEAIRDTAFVTSEYPVILSFENHCSKQQQCKMACYCTEIFGDMLLTKPLEGYPLEEGKPLPSPQVLKGRIIIKNKKLKPEQEQDEEHSEIFSDLDSGEASALDLYLGLRRGSAITTSSFGSRISQKTHSMKETAIVDGTNDVADDVVDDAADDVADDVTEHVSDDRENDPEWSETAENDPHADQTAKTNRLNDYLQYGDRCSAGLLKDCVKTAASEAKSTVSDTPADDIRQFKSASEYSAHLLSRILDDADLNPALKQDIEDELFSDIASTKQLSSTKDEKESISDGEGPPGSENNPKIPNGLSSSSSSSIVSDTPSDVSESTSTQAPTDTSVAKGKGASLPDVVPTSRFKQNGGLESIKEVVDSSESTFDLNSNTTESTRRRVTSTPTYSRKGSSASLVCSSSSDSISNELAGHRKGSCASTQSMESNPDEDEERDVLKALVKKREEKLASYGSSLKLSAYGKKSSRAQSLTPEDMSEILALSHQTTSGNIHPYLSSLVNYIHPVSFAGFKEAEKKNLSYNISSFNEANGFSLMKASPVDFVKYNKRQLSRIYPKGARVESSNYMPQVFWNVGCQMVSLNFQTSDLAFQLNQGKFEYNGRTGYILKPDIMRRADRVFDPFTEAPIDGLIAASLAVRVISGQFLSDRKIGTYVEVDLYGLPTDTIRKKHKTKVVSGNGMNPVYEKEDFKFKRLVVPELALLRFGVVDDNDGKLIAQRVIPLEGLQAGYRHIPMRSEHNMPLPLTTLFVHISLKTYVPEKFSEFVDELFEPMKYQSVADKRAAQMQVYEMEDGVLVNDETDVPPLMKNSTSLTSLSSKTKVTPSTNSAVFSPLMPGSGNSSLRQEAQMTESNLPKKEDTKFPPILLEDLKKDKVFLRVLKKHQKDVETLSKKYEKERSVMRRVHTSQLEKLVTNYEKVKLSVQRNFERALKKSGEDTELKQVHEVKLQHLNQTHTGKATTMLSEQTEEWTNMINRQVEEQIDFLEQQAEMQLESLKKVMDAQHDGQIKKLSNKHSRENIEIKDKQTKQSMEASKNLTAEKAKSSKEEKDRFQKELDQQNFKRFVEERQKLSERQEEELEEHRARHINEKKELETEFRKVSLETKAERMESIKSNGEALRRAIHTAFQTVLPSH